MDGGSGEVGEEEGQRHPQGEVDNNDDNNDDDDGGGPSP